MYFHDIAQLVSTNDYYRQVLVTGDFLQVTLMNIPVGEDIPSEVHQGADQLLVIVAGEALGEIDQKTYTLKPGDSLFIPCGLAHRITNSGDVPLKLYSVYSSPQHAPGAIHATKEDALRSEREENRRQWYE